VYHSLSTTCHHLVCLPIATTKLCHLFCISLYLLASVTIHSHLSRGYSLPHATPISSVYLEIVCHSPGPFYARNSALVSSATQYSVPTQKQLSPLQLRYLPVHLQYLSVPVATCVGSAAHLPLYPLQSHALLTLSRILLSYPPPRNDGECAAMHNTSDSASRPINVGTGPSSLAPAAVQP